MGVLNDQTLFRQAFEQQLDTIFPNMNASVSRNYLEACLVDAASLAVIRSDCFDLWETSADWSKFMHGRSSGVK